MGSSLSEKWYSPDNASERLQISGNGNQKMGKRIITLGYYDSGTGKHQSNTVYHFKGKTPAVTTITGGGYSTDKGVKKVEKKRITILGRIGNTEFQNNDSHKVLHRGG